MKPILEHMPLPASEPGPVLVAAPGPDDLPHPAEGDIQLSQVLFALSDPARLEIVAQLAGGPIEMARCYLSDPSLPKSTKSHLMKVLREAGVIRNAQRGRGRILSLRRAELDARFPGLLDAVLRGHAPAAAPLTAPAAALASQDDPEQT